MAYVVKLDNLNFDGPLDLLLQLISKSKIDIVDIFVSDITEQYLAHLKLMQEMDMAVTSEFLEMAALLVEIKSRALLPKVKETEEEESPEELLMRRIEEYKACKEQAEKLKTMAEENAGMVFRHPAEAMGAQRMDIDFSLDALMEAFDELLKKADKKRIRTPHEHRVMRERYSIHDAVQKIRSALLKRDKVKFIELFDDYDREEIVTTFMAILEMWKQNQIHITQKSTYSDIYIQHGRMA